MRLPYFVHSMGLALNVSAVASLLTTVSAFCFLPLANPSEPVTDVLSIVLMLSLIVVALALYFLLRSHAPMLSRAATTIGIVAMLVVAVYQTLLVVDVLTYEQVSFMTTFASAAIGIWLILANYIAMQHRIFPKILCWLGIVVGAANLVLVAGFLTAGLESPLFVAGSSIFYFVYPVWAFWLGRAYSRNRQPLVS